MRLVTFIAIAALTTGALAQSGTPGDGTAPINKGSTGWTGAHPETGGATTDAVTTDKPPQAIADQPKGAQDRPANATTGQAAQVHDQDLAQTQPLMATGLDLKGPPMRFAPSKTPE